MRELIFLIAAVGSLGVAAIAGLGGYLTSDQTGIVYLILVIGLIGTATSAAPRWRHWLHWLCNEGVALLFGLLGTVVGFTTSLYALAEGNPTATLDGLRTALSTTAVGLVVHVYLLLLRRSTDDER